MPNAATPEYVTVQVRLTTAERAVLKRAAKPNITAWLRTQLRLLPGGSELPPLETAQALPEAPPWRPRAVLAGGAPGDPTLQASAFVTAVSAIARKEKIQWRHWRPVHELYVGLEEVLTPSGLRTLWREANAWNERGRRVHSNQALYTALFDFASTRDDVFEWYRQAYKISSAKRRRAKERDPEGFLARHRAANVRYRAKLKAEAAAQATEIEKERLRQEFIADHVTEHGEALIPESTEILIGLGKEARRVGPLNGGVARRPVKTAERRGSAEVPPSLTRVPSLELLDGA